MECQQSIPRLLQHNNNWWLYYQENKDNIRPVVVENIVKMLSCGLSVRGTTLYQCSNQECTHSKYVAFTCKSRFCPSCGKKSTEVWIKKQQNLLPRTEWQHITFTMPKEIWRLFQLNRRLLNYLSKIAASTVLKMAKTKKITPGIFTALHTFGRDLKFNPHIHLSTTRGGLNEKQKWQKMYFKRNSLMRIWRYKIIKLIKTVYENGMLVLPDSLAQFCPDYKSFGKWLHRRYIKNWIVHCAKPSKNPFRDINYLGRYIKKPPIAQSRLRHYDGNIVIFNYLNHKNNRHTDFRCSPREFIRRFIQHIPEKNFRLIRYYGFLANRVRTKMLEIIYPLLDQTVFEKIKTTFNSLMKKTLGFEPLKCIICDNPLKRVTAIIGKSSKQLLKNHEQLAKMKLVF